MQVIDADDRHKICFIAGGQFAMAMPAYNQRIPSTMNILHFVSISIKAILLAGLVAISGWANATTSVYTDRYSFQFAAQTFTVDDLSDVESGPNSIYVRPGYTIATVTGLSTYGCLTDNGCGDNTLYGFDSGYLWNYPGIKTFTFKTAVKAFGFDYGNPPHCCQTTTVPIINGEAATAYQGFFGIISDTANEQYLVDQGGAYLMIDNITFGAPIPEPGTLVLAILGLTAVMVRCSRRRTA